VADITEARKTLEQFIKDAELSTTGAQEVAAAIRVVVEENERLRNRTRRQDDQEPILR